jgi:LmbE family N-acetylglucosaminyl deacetylase
VADNLRLLCVFAHPDDESLGTGGLLAKYAAEGVETYLVSATRGERGWQGDPAANPGLAGLGAIRSAELQAAAAVLGLRDVQFLDYIDGDLDQADPAEAIGRIVAHIRRVRPHVVVTFGPEGAYGHPDHIAISQFTAAALVAAADAGYAPGESAPHRVAKFYYKVWTPEEFRIYISAFGPQVMTVDGVNRGPVEWADWEITTRVDTTAHWQQVWQAISCHRSQLPGYGALASLPEDTHRQLWGTAGCYRVYSLVNGGRRQETDLFAGLR